MNWRAQRRCDRLRLENGKLKEALLVAENEVQSYVRCGNRDVSVLQMTSNKKASSARFLCSVAGVRSEFRSETAKRVHLFEGPCNTQDPLQSLVAPSSIILCMLCVQRDQLSDEVSRMTGSVPARRLRLTTGQRGDWNGAAAITAARRSRADPSAASGMLHLRATRGPDEHRPL